MSKASESLYGGQFTLSIQLIKPNYFSPLAPLVDQGRREPGNEVVSTLLILLNWPEVVLGADQKKMQALGDKNNA